MKVQIPSTCCLSFYIHWQIDISCDTFINVSVRLWRPSPIRMVGRGCSKVMCATARVGLISGDETGHFHLIRTCQWCHWGWLLDLWAENSAEHVHAEQCRTTHHWCWRGYRRYKCLSICFKFSTLVVIFPIRIQDGKQRFKHCGQYRDVTKSRKLSLTCIKRTSSNQTTQKNLEGRHGQVRTSNLWREPSFYHSNQGLRSQSCKFQCSSCYNSSFWSNCKVSHCYCGESLVETDGSKRPPPTTRMVTRPMLLWKSIRGNDLFS